MHDGSTEAASGAKSWEPHWEQQGASPERSHSTVSLTTLATIVVVCAILFIAKDLFLPLALGMLIAFILTPVVNLLRARGLSDMVSVILTVLIASALILAFGMVLWMQVSQIGANLPQYQGNVLSKIDGLLRAGEGNSMFSHLQGMVDLISARFENFTATPDESVTKVQVVEQTNLRDWVEGVIIPALSPFAIAGLVFVVVIFALLERGALRDRLVQLIGGTDILATSRMLADAGSRVSTYLVMQLVVNVIYALPIWLGLWLIGVPNALFFGLVTLIMRFVPYIGSITSATLPLLMAFAVSPDWSMFLWTAALFGVVELVTSNVIEPWLYGQRTGVSPLAVIVSAMFWTWLWGPIGLIMATPLTVCLVVIGNHVPNLRLFPIMLGDQPVLDDAAQLYDRLLAGHANALSDAATKTTARAYLAQYYDTTALPALSLAQADHQAGLLSDQQTARIAQAAWSLAGELESVVDDELAGATDAPVEGSDSLISNGVLDAVGRRIAVIGANTRFDDSAAQMVSQAMRAEGAEVLSLPHRSAISEALTQFRPDVVIFASLDANPGSTVELRIRQLRRRLGKVRIGLAVWPPRQGEPAAATRNSAADFVARGMEATFASAFAKPVA